MATQYMKKKIIIDGLTLVEGHFSGVGQYVLGIVRGLDEILDSAKYSGEKLPKIEIVIPYNTVAKFKGYGFKHIKYRRFPLPFRYMTALWVRRWLPPMDLIYGPGVYIFPRFVSMPLLYSRSMTVIFDLSYEKYKQYTLEKSANMLSKKVRQSIKGTDQIITISQSAKNELIDFYSLEGKKVTIAYPATDPRVFYRRSDDEISRVKAKYGIRGDYILALSNLEPRKNLDSLVDAYCDLPEEKRKDLSLLLVGVSGWKTDALFQKITDRVNHGFKIIRPTKYVLDEDKPAVISGAKILVYPSHYEGFGMPPLEALACGVPVITSDNSSLPEVVKGVGVMIPSDSTPSILRAITDYLDDYNAVSHRARTEGPKRADSFSWISSAQRYLDVVEKLSK